jgi:hypothetical protein
MKPKQVVQSVEEIRRNWRFAEIRNGIMVGEKGAIKWLISRLVIR